MMKKKSSERGKRKRPFKPLQLPRRKESKRRLKGRKKKRGREKKMKFSKKKRQGKLLRRQGKRRSERLMRLRLRKLLSLRWKRISFKKRLSKSILQRKPLPRRFIKILMSLRYLRNSRIEDSMSVILLETLIVMKREMLSLTSQDKKMENTPIIRAVRPTKEAI